MNIRGFYSDPTKLQELRDLAALGKNARQIAVIQVTTRNTVASAAGKLGIELVAGPVPGKPKPKAVRRAAVDLEEEPEDEQRKPRVPLPAVEAPGRFSTTLAQLPTRCCKWPVGEVDFTQPQACAEQLLCGVDWSGEGPYCEKHEARAGGQRQTPNMKRATSRLVANLDKRSR